MSQPPNPRKRHQCVDAFIDKQPKEEVRDNCRTLIKLMQELAGEAPHKYGPTIIGFGTYHYICASGHSGSAPLAAFSPRKPELVIYLSGSAGTGDARQARKAPGHQRLLVSEAAGRHRSQGAVTLVKKSIAVVRRTSPDRSPGEGHSPPIIKNNSKQ